jgi:hypothetical protein
MKRRLTTDYGLRGLFQARLEGKRAPRPVKRVHQSFNPDQPLPAIVSSAGLSSPDCLHFSVFASWTWDILVAPNFAAKTINSTGQQQPAPVRFTTTGHFLVGGGAFTPSLSSNGTGCPVALVFFQFLWNVLAVSEMHK